MSSVNGCVDSDSLTVYVLVKRDVYIPNAFSPNDDGRNDWFTVFSGPEVARVKSLDIWSRWGEMVFHGTDLIPNLEKSGWDGSFRGKTALSGVFTWVAVLEFVDGEELMYKGDVTLVR